MIVSTASGTPKLLPAPTGMRAKIPSSVVFWGAPPPFCGTTTGTGAPLQYALDEGRTNTNWPGSITACHKPLLSSFMAPAATTTYFNWTIWARPWSCYVAAPSIYDQRPVLAPDPPEQPRAATAKSRPSPHWNSSNRYFRFTWGPPRLDKALYHRDPRHVTRAPRKQRRQKHVHVDIDKVLTALGTECVILRQYDETHRSYNSWYRLKEPLPATATVGLCTQPGVELMYEHKGPRQCARFYIKLDTVPESERSTHIVKVSEKMRDQRGIAETAQYETRMTTTVPEAAFEAMLKGQYVPGDVVARLNQSIMENGPKSEETNRLWAALRGETPVCLYFKP